MRIISLNVAQLVGRSGFIPLAPLREATVAPRLAALLAAEQPDALLLQEAPAPRGPSDPIATLLGGGPRPRVVRHGGARHGPALLTRHRVRHADASLFKPAGMNGKGWALAEIDTPDGPLALVSIHLAVLSRRSREAQIDRLADLLRGRRGHVVVMGDVNDGGRAPLYLASRTGLVPHSAGPTFPSTAPTLRLDWAFVSERVRVRSITALSHLPSDHCAVRLDLGLAPAGARGGGAA